MKQKHPFYLFIVLVALLTGFNSCLQEEEFIAQRSTNFSDYKQEIINWQEFKSKFDINRLSGNIQSRLKIDKKTSIFARSIEEEYVIDNEKILQTTEPRGTSYVMDIEKIEKSEEDLYKIVNLVVEEKAGEIRTYIVEYTKNIDDGKISKIKTFNEELEEEGSIDLPLEQQFTPPNSLNNMGHCYKIYDIIEVGDFVIIIYEEVPCGSNGGGNNNGDPSGPPNNGGPTPPPSGPNPPNNGGPNPPPSDPTPPPPPPSGPITPPTGGPVTPPVTPPSYPGGTTGGNPGGYVPGTGPAPVNPSNTPPPANVAIGILDESSEDNPSTACSTLRKNSENLIFQNKVDSLKQLVLTSNPNHSSDETFILVEKKSNGKLEYFTYNTNLITATSKEVQTRGSNLAIMTLHNHPINTIPIFSYKDIVHSYMQYKYTYGSRKNLFVAYLTNFNGETYALQFNDTSALDTLFADINLDMATTTEADMEKAYALMKVIFEENKMTRNHQYTATEAESAFMAILNDKKMGYGNSISIYKTDTYGNWGKIKPDLSVEYCP